MKKIKLTAALLIAAITISGCAEGNPEQPEQPQNQQEQDEFANVKEIVDAYATVDRRFYPSLQHLLEPTEWYGAAEDFSTDLVVIGEFVEKTKSERRYHYDEQFEKDIWDWADSYNQLLIIDVLKGDVKAGETIPIAQAYVVDENKFFSFDALTPMNKGDRWIFFLSYNDYLESYSILQGRYPIPNKEIMRVMDEYRKNQDKTKAVEAVDTALLGMLNPYDFRLDLYAELLEHFDIPTQDWTNPGRDSDARLIELLEKQS